MTGANMKETNHEQININIPAEGTTEAQSRLIKRLSLMAAHVLKTGSEEEYFEGSAEMMRLCAALIRTAHFKKCSAASGIPYSLQALEYALDVLNEEIEASKTLGFDN
jgi:hypothetical protein